MISEINVIAAKMQNRIVNPIISSKYLLTKNPPNADKLKDDPIYAKTCGPVLSIN